MILSVVSLDTGIITNDDTYHDTINIKNPQSEQSTYSVREPAQTDFSANPTSVQHSKYDIKNSMKKVIMTECLQAKGK